jgi:LysR family nitrogen assimilation transcriptional regulator
MDLKRLRTFVAVAEQGTVSKAALALRITQPALSRQIGDLQQDLGLKLFRRSGRCLVLTREGEQLLGDCRTVLSIADALNEQAQLLRQGDTGVLRVAAAPQTIESVLPSFLHRYAERYPGVRVKLVEALASDHLVMLERGEVHLAINVFQESDERFASYPLPPLEVLAVANRPLLLDEGMVDVRTLIGVPLLLPTSGFATRQLFDAACRLVRLEPSVFVESSAPHSLLALAAAGHGVAVIPSTVRVEHPDLRVARIGYDRKTLQTPRAVLWDRKRPLPGFAQGFLAPLATHMREVFASQRPAAAVDTPKPRRRT